MCSRAGFSLLEVIIAIVLLAIVVVVCVPYLRAGQGTDTLADSSAFHVRVTEALAGMPRQSTTMMDTQHYAEFARSNGWTCERIDQISTFEEQDELAREWVVISDGQSSCILWAAPEEEPSP